MINIYSKYKAKFNTDSNIAYECTTFEIPFETPNRIELIEYIINNTTPSSNSFTLIENSSIKAIPLKTEKVAKNLSENIVKVFLGLFLLFVGSIALTMTLCGGLTFLGSIPALLLGIFSVFTSDMPNIIGTFVGLPFFLLISALFAWGGFKLLNVISKSFKNIVTPTETSEYLICIILLNEHSAKDKISFRICSKDLYLDVLNKVQPSKNSINTYSKNI